MKPPVEEPEGFDEAIALLESLSLLSPVQYADDDPTPFRPSLDGACPGRAGLGR